MTLHEDTFMEKMSSTMIKHSFTCHQLLSKLNEDNPINVDFQNLKSYFLSNFCSFLGQIVGSKIKNEVEYIEFTLPFLQILFVLGPVEAFLNYTGSF